MEIANNNLICPNNNCLNIPEISYSYEPMNPTIKYKCNSISHEPIEKKMKLNDFLANTFPNIQCSICNNIIKNKEFIYSKNNKKYIHMDCIYNYGYSIEEDYIIIDFNYLLNNCLIHFNKFRFYCHNCNVSLCTKCNIDEHDEKKHEISQLINLRNNQNNKDKFKSVIDKQRLLLNKIKNINNELIQSLENDIIIKEKILDNYEKNEYNFQSIQNFNNAEINNDQYFEKLLDDVIKKYEKFEKNEKNEKNEEILVNAILSPLYYFMMINNNQNLSNNINNILGKKAINMNNHEKQKEKENNSLDFSIDLNIEDKNLEKNKIKKHYFNKKQKFIHEEIKSIKQEKSIFNMIILHTGNIAISSMGAVLIYDKNNLLSPNEKEYLLQRINFSNNKRVGYVFEYPDQTFFCSTFSRIFHLKLIENDKKYTTLGIIDLEQTEIPIKLISLKEQFLAVLSVENGKSFIRLFIKDKKVEDKNLSFNKNKININNNDEEKDKNKNIDSDDQSAGILSDYIDYLDKKNIEIDKEFHPYSKENNANIEKRLICSIFELKKNNGNRKEYAYEFISTSNSIYDYGDDKLVFYEVINEIKENIEVKKLKTIKNISCSTEVDSICQFNNQIICLGLQNHIKYGQKNGFVLINIIKREISQFISELAVYSLSFNMEKKLLYSAMDEVNKNMKNKFIINIFEIVEGKGKIKFKKIYKFKSKHKDIIVSLFDLKKDINDEIIKENIVDEMNIISASIDSTLRLTKINN